MRLLELHLRGVEPADDHQIAPEDLVGFGVGDVELEGSGEGLDGVADFLLREETVAERVPCPRGLRTLLDVLGEQRLDLLELSLSNVGFERRDPAPIRRIRSLRLAAMVSR